MGFDPAHYQSRITLAGGDFRSCFTSDSVTESGHWHRMAAELGLIAPAAVALAEAGASILITPTDAESEAILGALRENDEKNRASSVEWLRRIALSERGALSGIRVPDGSGPACIWGAIGPVDPLLTLSEVEESLLTEAFSNQARALAEGGVDAILCRGFTELESLVIAVKSAKDAASLPVIGSMIFDSGHDYSQTPMAVTIPQAARALADAGACMMGTDGSEFPDGAPAVVSLIRASSTLPVSVEVTAGRPELTETGIRYPESPKLFAERLERLIDAGATIVSGGRGVTVAHMTEMSKIAVRLRKRRRPDVGNR